MGNISIELPQKSIQFDVKLLIQVKQIMFTSMPSKSLSINFKQVIGF